jgi:hypothetical protein
MANFFSSTRTDPTTKTTTFQLTAEKKLLTTLASPILARFVATEEQSELQMSHLMQMIYLIVLAFIGLILVASIIFIVSICFRMLSRVHTGRVGKWETFVDEVKV